MWIKVLREKTERKYPKFLRMPTEFRSLEFQEVYFDELYSGTANSFNSFASNSGTICLRSNDTVRNIYQTFGTSDFIFIWNKETQEPTTECDFVANIVNVDVQTFTGNAQKTITLFYKINSFYMYGDLAKFDETNVSRIKYGNYKKYKTEMEKPTIPPTITTEYDSNLVSIIAVVQFYNATDAVQKRTNHVCFIEKVDANVPAPPPERPTIDMSFDDARKFIFAIESSMYIPLFDWYNHEGQVTTDAPQENYEIIKFYIVPKEYTQSMEYDLSGYLQSNVKIDGVYKGIRFKTIPTFDGQMEELTINNSNIIACGYFGQWLPIEPHKATQQRIQRKFSIDDDFHLVYYLNGTEIEIQSAFEYNAPFTGENATDWDAKQRAYRFAKEEQNNKEFAFEMQKKLQENNEMYAKGRFAMGLVQSVGSGIGNAFLSSNANASLFGSAIKISGDVGSEVLREQQQQQINQINNEITERNLKTQSTRLAQEYPRQTMTKQSQLQNVRENAKGLLFVTVQSDVNDKFAERYGYETNFIIDGNLEDELRLLIPYPNLQNYIQTNGCSVYGVPYEVAKDIESLFDSGVIIAKNI